MRLTAKQTMNDQTDTLFMETTASYSKTDDGYVLRYRDEGGDLHGTRNVLTVTPGEGLTLLRDGPYSTRLIIDLGRRHLSQYETPYGMLMLGICGLKLESDVDETGGTLHFRYTTDVELSVVGEFDFDIRLTPKALSDQTEDMI